MSEGPRIPRRAFVKVGATGMGLLLAACTPKVVEKIVKETVVMEKEVPKEVTKVVEKEVTKVVVAQPSKAPIVLRLATQAGRETSESGIYVDRPKEFTQETGVQVKLELIPAAEYMVKLEAMAVSGTLADTVMTTQITWMTSRLAHFGLLLPLNDYMDAAGVSRDEWMPHAIGALTIGGKVYGLPRTSHPTSAYVFVNQDMLEAAGLKMLPDYGTTWDQLMEYGKALSKGPADRREVYGYYTMTNHFFNLVNGVRSFGGWELDVEGKEALVDQWREHLTWNYNALVKDRISPHSSQLDSSGLQGMFAAKKLAMFQSGMWEMKGLRAAVGPEAGGGKFRWKMVGLPEGPRFNGWGASLSTQAPTMQSQHKLEAYKLQYAMSDKRFAYIIANTYAYLVGRTKELEEIGPAANDPAMVMQFKQHTKAVPIRVGRNYRGDEFNSTLVNTIDKLYIAGAQPNDAFFNELKTTLNGVLQRPVA